MISILQVLAPAGATTVTLYTVMRENDPVLLQAQLQYPTIIVRPRRRRYSTLQYPTIVVRPAGAATVPVYGNMR